MKLLISNLAGLAALLLFPLQIKALPQIDQSHAIDSLGGEYWSQIYPDDLDPDLFHIPYSRIELVPDEENPNRPSFSLAYLPQGIILNAEIKVRYDNEQIESIMAAIKQTHPQAKFRMLDIDQGYLVPTLRTNQGIHTFLSAEKSYIIPHHSPGRTRKISLFITGSDAELMMLSIKDGLAIGINYFYDFKAAATPTSVSVDIDWSRLRSELNSIPELRLPIASTTFPAMMTKLENRRLIDIKINGAIQNFQPIYEKVAQIIRDTCFEERPLGPTGSFLRFRADSCQRPSETFFFEILDITTYRGVAGFKIPSLCLSYPELFRYIDMSGGIRSGCPDGIYAEERPMEPITAINFDESFFYVPEPLFEDER